MEGYSDSESNTSFIELHSRGLTDDQDNGILANQEREQDRTRTNWRFLEKKHQIREITTLVRALVEQVN